MRATEAQPSQRFIHSPPPLAPPKHYLLTETGDPRVQLIILGSLTWQNPPFNEIRSRMLRQEDSFQGQKIGLVSTHFRLQFCILPLFSKENALNHNHKATRVQTVITKRTRFKINCAFHPIMSHKKTSILFKHNRVFQKQPLYIHFLSTVLHLTVFFCKYHLN